jgi:hypothetical protein
VGDEQANVSPTATAGSDGSHRHETISIAREPITKAVPDRFDGAERDDATMITTPGEMVDDDERAGDGCGGGGRRRRTIATDHGGQGRLKSNGKERGGGRVN